MNILGIHGGVSINQHDPAAAIVCDGKLVACIEEERLMRIKSPRGLLPIESIRACLKEAGLNIRDIDVLAHPGETYDDMPPRIESYMTHYFGYCPPIKLVNHQMAHLASAFYHSGYDRAMCLSYDAYGDRLSAALGLGTPEGIQTLETRPWDDSLGTFYATMTSFLGFLPAEDEYKVMGLAPYGNHVYDLSAFARPTENGYTVDRTFLRHDPPIKSNWEPFYNEKLIEILGEPRHKGEPITQRHRDIACSTQRTLEECALSLVRYLHRLTGERKLCLAGGVALNCTCNHVLRGLDCVDEIFVQPSASDRGLALGCALHAAAEGGEKIEPLTHVYYGKTYTDVDIEYAVRLTGFQATRLDDPGERAAKMLADGCIIGWFQGRAEFGPRALGHRSILADARLASMKDEINARVKFREEFRPFAPSVLEERCGEVFVMKKPSPYMTVAFPVQEEWKAKIPAVTHINGTARVQTVSKDASPEYHNLISHFEKLTGVPLVLNTSFNVKGQPIVETPLDALSTFAATGMDAVFIGNYMVEKPSKPRG